MAWVAPPVFVSGNVLTAAQMNILSGDINESAVAKATGSGRFYVSTAANTLAERLPVVISANVTEATSSAAFVDLATVGPTATVIHGPWALVAMQSMVQPSAVGASGQVGLDISGATTIPPSPIYLSITAAAVNQQVTAAGVRIISALTAGTSDFKMMYQVSGAVSVNFGRRYLSVIPF